MDDDLHRCRVCGLHHGEFFPWGETGTLSSFGICECCGTTFGYEDSMLSSVRAARARWLEAGGGWWSTRPGAPEGWNRDEQLAAIPERWR